MKLYLDLSQSKVSLVRLLDKEKIVAEKSGSDTLTLIDAILKENKLNLKEIEEVDSFPGPGIYTGLRIAAAIAGAINYSLGKDKKTILKYD